MKNSCCFFGHKNTPAEIRPKLIRTISALIEKHGITNYYVGNQGNFDYMVLSVLRELAVSYPKIHYTVVLAYLPDKNSFLTDVNTVYPEGLESVPKRFCIARRNDWLIEHSHYTVCYVTHNTGGAAQFMQKAQRKKRIVINLACF